jgi:hypothetical protein
MQDHWLPIVNGKVVSLAKYTSKKMTHNQKKKVESFWGHIEPQAVRTVGQPLGEVVLRQNLVMDEAIRMGASQPASQSTHITANDKV